MTTTKKELKAKELAARVTRVNDLRILINSQYYDDPTVFLKQKKQLAMDLYHFFLGLDKQGKIDDDAPLLSELPRLPKKPAPLEVPELPEPTVVITEDDMHGE